MGSFSADIYCKDTVDGSGVLIENQLEQTDHTHLGQVLTYSAGLDIRTVIWIAKDFREEHRAALDHLNEITDERFGCFGVEIKVWQIGNSVRAPQFEIVAKPNDWSRSLSVPSLDNWKTKFWSHLQEYFRAENHRYQKRRPVSYNESSFSIGKSEFSLLARVSKQKKHLRVRLYLTGKDAPAHFYLLEAQQADIEAEFGAELEWSKVSKVKNFAISLYKTETDPTDEDNWPDQHKWLASNLEKFNQVFRPRIKQLDPADWSPPDDEDEEDI